MNSTRKTYFNEIPAGESRHILLKCIKAFNVTTIVLVVLGFMTLMGHQVYTWALQAPFFEIKKIDVRGNCIVSQERVLILAGIDPQCNIFRMDVDAVEKRILENCFVRNVNVSRRLPSKVVLSIEERRPVVFLENVMGMVDGEGVLLPPTSFEQWSDLPSLTGVEIQDVAFGEPLQSAPIGWAISFLKDVAAMKSGAPFEITEIDVSDLQHPLLYTGDGSVPIRIGPTGSPSQLISLPTVLTDLARKGIEAEYIDVRFSDQIIVRPRR